MKLETPQNRTFREYLILGVKGFCMGAADVVPGVSGGTMAFILGIYRELIASIKSINMDFGRLLLSGKIKDAMGVVSWQFLVAVATGVFAAIFTIAKFLSYMLSAYPVWVWSFFFGLVLSSAVTICLEINRWTLKVIMAIVFGTALAFYIVGQVPVSTPETPWFLFISGAVAICAMILPGISGAFILVLLGKYQYVLDAVNNLDFFTLAVVTSGAVVGLMSFARILSWLFKKYQNMTIALLVGLMLGSLRKIWPWKTDMAIYDEKLSEWVVVTQVNMLPSQLDFEVFIGFVLMMLGMVMVISMKYIAKTKSFD
jgi:putative membrane protein